MAFNDCEVKVCEASLETPLQQEIRHLKYQVANELQGIRHAQERLLIARAKLAAVKKLVK